jgi:hypothetical protein
MRLQTLLGQLHDDAVKVFAASLSDTPHRPGEIETSVNALLQAIQHTVAMNESLKYHSNLL